MKLIRVGESGVEKPGLLLPDGRRVDVSKRFRDYDESFFAHDGLRQLSKWMEAEGNSAPLFSTEERLGPPIARPSKIICVGLNFSDHAEESGMEPPAEPVLFFKATTALCGPNDALVLPRGGDKTDWEVELAVVIGKTAKYVEPEDASEHIAGYCLHNDYSERAFQLERCGQWVKGKSADTFAPLGPFLATPDEVTDVDSLGMWLRVNGETMQNGTSANLIFKVPFLVSYISQFMTLLPGDVISTGTPAGVGLGLKPPRYLKAGDVVELGIVALGEQRQEVVGAPGAAAVVLEGKEDYYAN
jgi:2,4-didehydro-3-deoxy-L-rhamnonate hydrolase